MPKIYRPGGLGAMQGEYERAAAELIAMLENINEAAYIANHPEESEFHRSIHEITSHVLRSGFGYTNKIRKTMGIDAAVEVPKELLNREQIISMLRKLLIYSAESFEGKWQMSDEELDHLKMPTPWGVEYSVEQMMEHAIVHILRHRRQIERLLGR